MLLLPNPLKSLFFGFSGKHLVLNSSLPSNKLTKAAKKQFFSFPEINAIFLSSTEIIVLTPPFL